MRILTRIYDIDMHESVAGARMSRPDSYEHTFSVVNNFWRH